MSRPLSRPAGIAAVIAAILLAVTAIWYALYSSGVTVPPPPATGSLDQQYEAYYRSWFPSVAVQDIALSLVATVAFLVLSGAGALLARASLDHTRRFLAGWAIAAGAALAAGSFLVQVGGHGAVADGGQTTTAATIVGFGAFLVDRVAGAMLLAAYGLVGIGILAAAGDGAARVVGVLAGGALVALSVTGFLRDPLGYEDALRLAVAVVLVPAWAVTLLRQAPAPAGAEPRPAATALGVP